MNLRNVMEGDGLLEIIDSLKREHEIMLLQNMLEDVGEE